MHVSVTYCPHHAELPSHRRQIYLLLLLLLLQGTHMAAQLTPKPHSRIITRLPRALQMLRKLLVTRPRPHLPAAFCRIVLKLPQVVCVAAAEGVRRFVGPFAAVTEAFAAAGAVAACGDWERALEV
jgi:hypothetical protein